MTFTQILDAIVVPRENGSDALARVAHYLEQTLRATGAEVSVHEFICRPYVGRIIGAVALMIAAAYIVAMWRRRFGVALLLLVLLAAYLQLEHSGELPLLSRLGAVPERNIVGRFGSSQPERTVILSAHYDTKTDLLDHYQRAPIQFLIVPLLIVALIMTLTAVWRSWRGRSEGQVRGWAVMVPLYFVGFFLTTAGGVFVSARSPGALDDGAAVATLLKLAEALAGGEPPLRHTDVEIVLFAGEEVGLQGSSRYVAERGARDRPTYVVNLEGWGFGRQLSYFTSDRSVLRRYDASAALTRALDRAYRRQSRGEGLLPDIQPVSTDARSFMAAGIPSVTLVSRRDREHRIRFLHSAADTRDRIQPGALEDGLAFLQAALAEIDENGIASASR